MHLRAGTEGGGYAGADLHGLDGLQRHDGGGEEGVEALVPLRVGAEAGRNVVGDDFEDAAEGVSGLEYLVDFIFHALLGVRVGAVEQNFVALVQGANFFPGNLIVQGHAAGGDDVAEDIDAEFAQKQLGDGADGNAGGGFAGGGALEDVSGFGKIVFQCSGQVGVPGAWRGDALVLGGIAGADGKGFLPVLPVTI